MKIARFFAVIFGCIGTALLLGSMGFFLLNRNADVRVRKLPQEAVSVSENFVRALNEGNLETAAQLIYGQPDLGISGVLENPETAFVWEAFCNSITVELNGEWQVEQSALVQSGTITNMDVFDVLARLPKVVQSLLDQRVAGAENLSEIYDEQNNYREELVQEILQEALRQTLSQNGATVTREVTLKLINRDGVWWIVPDQALLQALSGVA